MNNLRSEYIKEWRIWYNAFNKARKEGVEIYAPWLDFHIWFADLGPRPNPSDHFCRDDWEGAWTPDNAGWRSMPKGRNRPYRKFYNPN